MVLLDGNTEWDNMRALVDPRVAKATIKTEGLLVRGETAKKAQEGATKDQLVRLHAPLFLRLRFANPHACSRALTRVGLRARAALKPNAIAPKASSH